MYSCVCVTGSCHLKSVSTESCLRLVIKARCSSLEIFVTRICENEVLTKKNVHVDCNNILKDAINV